jgi:uncharacterized protein
MNYTIITGASKGIGRELAIQYAKNGNNLILVARSLPLLEDLKSELILKYNIAIHLLELDLTTDNAINILVNYCTTNNLNIENLVNNAGFGDFSSFKESDINKIKSMLDLNMRVLTELTYVFLKEIIANKGRIMLLASTAAFLPIPGMAVYAATKAYVRSFGVAVNEEIKSTGASITVICPGPTATEFQEVAELDKSKFVSSKLTSAKELAVFAFKKTQQRQVIVTQGLSNAITVNIVPRILAYADCAKILKNIFKEK